MVAGLDAVGGAGPTSPTGPVRVAGSTGRRNLAPLPDRGGTALDQDQVPAVDGREGASWTLGGELEVKGRGGGCCGGKGGGRVHPAVGGRRGKPVDGGAGQDTDLR